MKQGMQGFTLTELSIVLIVVGLVAGGVLASYDLVRSAEIRSYVTDLERYHNSVQMFRKKYQALPGDMYNATAQWGAAAAGATCKTTPTPSGSNATCNGDGDGIIEFTGVTNSQEQFRFWQQLAAAGLIPGNFTGTAGPLGQRHAQIGINIPAARATDVGYSIESYGARSADTYFWDGQWDNIIKIGKEDGLNHPAEGPALTAAEALSLDTKIDDGKPASGLLQDLKNGATNPCNTTNVASTAAYDVSQNGEVCQMLFRLTL